MSRKKSSRRHTTNIIEYPKDNNLQLKIFKPITEKQHETYQSYYQNQNLVLHGTAGTGKTFISLYLALSSIEDQEFNKLIIVRSAVQTRNVGFMPGNLSEKGKIYEEPYPPIVNQFFGRDDAYEILKKKHIIEFITTSNIRGKTFDNAIIVVDEFQNMDDGELHTVMTRLGKNSKIMFCGDNQQDDLTSARFHEETGIEKFKRILTNMKEFDIIEFGIPDIVRSGVVKNYIIARENYEQNFRPPVS